MVALTILSSSEMLQRAIEHQVILVISGYAACNFRVIGYVRINRNQECSGYLGAEYRGKVLELIQRIANAHLWYLLPKRQ
jgi:hypothetical protein